MRTTIVHRSTRWALVAAAMLGLVTAVLAGPFGSALASGEPTLGTLTPDPGKDTGSTTAAINDWTTLTASGACPASHRVSGTLRAITDPENRTIAGSVAITPFLPTAQAGTDTTPATVTAKAVWTILRTLPEFQEPATYEIVLFCASDIPSTDENSVPAFSAWLTFNATTWWITADPATADPTEITLRAVVGGQTVTTVEPGTDVELVATVSPAEAAGTVEFQVDGEEHGTEAVSNGTASVSLDDVELGDYDLTASFVSGDEDEYASSETASPTVLTVEESIAEPTTTTLTVSPASPVDVGTPVTLTASVNPAAAAGSVEFVAGETVIGGEPVPLDDGVATVTTTALPEGILSLQALFTPDDSDAFSSSTSDLVSYIVGDAHLLVTAVDVEGNVLGDNPMLTEGQEVRLTAPGFQDDEEGIAVAVDAASEAPVELGEVPADDEGTVIVDFTASNLEPGQHQVDFAGAEHEIAWRFQMEGDPGDENGAEDGDEGGTEDGDATGDTSGDADGGDDAAAGTADGAVGGSPAGTGSNLAQTGAFLVGPAVLLGLAALSAGYGFIRRSRRDEFLTFDDEPST